MTGRRRLLAVAAGLVLTGTGVLSLAAPSPADLDPDERRTGIVDITPPSARRDGGPGRVAAEAEPPARHGNPLWAIPLETLTETRARPLFSASRRPPPPAVAAPPPASAAPPPPPAPSPPARPRLELIGIVVNSRGGFGVFLDPAAGAVVRLKTGEAHDGWILRSVSGRDVMLQHDRNTAVLTLPARDAESTARTPTLRLPAASGTPAVVVPRSPPPLIEPYPDH